MQGKSSQKNGKTKAQSSSLKLSGLSTAQFLYELLLPSLHTNVPSVSVSLSPIQQSPSALELLMESTAVFSSALAMLARSPPHV